SPGRFPTHSPSSTGSVHRRLPSLPIKSAGVTTTIIDTCTATTAPTTSLVGYFHPTTSPMSTNLFSPTIVSRSVQPIVKEDHRYSINC
ncbi:unnamed protein product, partial [Onchocerca flexuosa]|uniref:Ovule protein n=1 Tax=Onchocerca flexuosa TaxID=387005 RepID=A0A183HPW9_9BILA